MFGIFKKKSKIDLLQGKYKKLMKEAFDLSTVNRAQSDQKHAEADAVMTEIEALQKQGNG